MGPVYPVNPASAISSASAQISSPNAASLSVTEAAAAEFFPHPGQSGILPLLVEFVGGPHNLFFCDCHSVIYLFFCML